MRTLSRREAFVAGGAALLFGAAATAGIVLATRDDPAVVEIAVGGELVFYDFPELIADLKADGRVRRHVKLAIVVELPDDLRPRLEVSLTTIVDALNAYLREQRPEDLTGAAGATRVRQALSAIINGSLAPGEVKAVLFREFILS